MNIANRLSLFRILSAPLFIISLLYYSAQREYLRIIAIAIFFVAVVSDIVDGYLARKHRQNTAIGRLLDPLADKILLMSAFICLYLINKFPQGIHFPLAVVLIVIGRDILLLCGSGVIYLLRKDIRIQPTCWGKLTTFFQILSVFSILFQWGYSYILWRIAVVFTLISGIDYLVKGIGLLYGHNNYSQPV
jgi:cardiolipin synthase